MVLCCCVLVGICKRIDRNYIYDEMAAGVAVKGCSNSGCGLCTGDKRKTGRLMVPLHAESETTRLSVSKDRLNDSCRVRDSKVSVCSLVGYTGSGFLLS